MTFEEAHKQAFAELTEGLRQSDSKDHDFGMDKVIGAMLDGLADDELEDLQEGLLRFIAEAPARIGIPVTIFRGVVNTIISGRLEDAQEAIRDANGGHQVYVIEEKGEWHFDCWCLGNEPETEPPHRSTEEEALADMVAHMFEQGLNEAAYDPHLMPPVSID